MSAQTLQFKTELKQLLHIIIHSLYSHKEIFLRELISNASDAIDTRALPVADARRAAGRQRATGRSSSSPTRRAGTLTISDNGIGMSQETIVENLGTIAKSGTQGVSGKPASRPTSKERPELIGQFGVGFYSAFMVADKVTVDLAHGRRPEGPGRPVGVGRPGRVHRRDRSTKATRGTDVILHLKARRQASSSTRGGCARLVKKYSDFVEHPDRHGRREGRRGRQEDDRRGDAQLAQGDLAAAARPRSRKEEYDEFYKHLSHDHEPPAKMIHYRPRGPSSSRRCSTSRRTGRST